MAIDESLYRAARKLSRELAVMSFAEPVTHVYDPIVYAAAPHREYLRRYAHSQKRVVFLGMNPGPYGMAQTGVPFGEIAHVRDWLRIEGVVRRPEAEHPKRPITGFACTRNEVSGARLWGAFRERFGQPQRFFADHFVANYCPLVFMEAGGKNRTPDKLTPAERDGLYAACDAHLRTLVRHLKPQWVIGVGKFAEGRAAAALDGVDVRIATILHPSPASPLANRGWAPQMDKQMAALGLPLPAVTPVTPVTGGA